LIRAIRDFLKRLEFFEVDIQSKLNCFPINLEQNRGKNDTSYVQLVENLIANIAIRFGEFLKTVAAVS